MPSEDFTSSYNNYIATYDDLLALENKLKTRQRHLQFLPTEIYKSTNKLNPSFMWKAYNEKIIPYYIHISACKTFWLSVVLFLNFNVYYSMYLCKYF